MCLLCDFRSAPPRGRRAFLLAAGAAAASPALAQVDVGEASVARNLVPAESIERAGVQQYHQLLAQARAKGLLAPDGNAQLQRLRAIASKIIPFAAQWNPRAASWKWEVNLIASKQINAFCMPGGKIAFFTGILEQLKLSDDEVAMVMGHEMAHALREHGRERVGKMRLAQIGTVIASIGGALLGFGDLGGQVASGAAQLTMLKYGRDDETEADLVGLELAARAGFDPRAGVIVWQKMAAVGKGQPPQWLSSHPSHDSRISEISRNLDRVMPLYASARGVSPAELGPYRSNVGKPVPWPLVTAKR